jgi:hypothetical protein
VLNRGTFVITLWLAPTMHFPSVARRSGCIQHIVWLALNIAGWSNSIKRPSACGRNSERR